MGTELTSKTAAELSTLLEQRAISAVDTMEAFIHRAEARNDYVRAILHLDKDDALKQAEESDLRRRKGETRGPLDGIPVGIKDILAVKNQPLTCASRILEKFVSPYDAHCIELLKAAGAIPFGRLNMDEFAMGSSCETSFRGPTRNPHDLERVPGGSSGGSAAVVADHQAPLSLGTDTGGSIRQPAAFCGVVGMKPTYGLVSRYGLVAFASSLDQVGPFGHTVEDCALLLQAVAGHDSRDSTSYKTDIPDYRTALREKKGPWTIGIPREYFGEGLDPEIKEAVEEVIENYKSQGCTIVDVSLPHMELAVPVYYVLAPAEASSNLARYDGVRWSRRSEQVENAVDLYFKSRGEGFGPEVKRRIILGTYVLSSGYYDAYYVRAQKVRTLIRNDFMEAYNKVDVLLTPTTPNVAFKCNELAGDPMQMYLQDLYTISVNLAGLPGISIPCGKTEAGLPIGFQLIGQPFMEAEMMAVGYSYDVTY